jgi:hypothetical protein
MNEDYSEEADSLIDQLKENTGLIKKVSKRKGFELDKDDLEQFILNSSGKLIKDSLEVIDDMRDYVEAAPDAESISSLAELMKASTNAIDTLNKVLIQDKRSATQVGVKKMDIEAKKELETSNQSKNLLTREDVFKKLLEDAKVIDLEETD